MTLGEFFDIASNNPSVILFFFIAVPLTALLAWIFGRKEAHISPWKYLYTVLIYLALVPGLFAITIAIYMLLVDQKGIEELSVFTQVVPILSMFLTVFLIKQNATIKDIPGFGKLSGLILIIAVVLILLIILDRMHVLAITSFPFSYVIIFLVVLFIIIRMGLKRMIS